MSYSTKQNKKTLGIENLKGVTVQNTKSGTGYNVTFRAEVMRDGFRYLQANLPTPKEAAKVANSFFKDIYGSYQSAKKAGFWNTVK